MLGPFFWTLSEIKSIFAEFFGNRTVALEVIIRRANLQTTGTIYNKETQLLGFADDINIVGRCQSAVRNAYLALEGEAAKVGLKICVPRIPDDTNE
jgi:hypothetical protein